MISVFDPLTPDAALRELLEGNRRFARGRLTAHEQDLAALRRDTARSQEPFAAVLACADSRVPVEMIFDQGINRIFTARVAGNIVTTEIMASLEFAAAVVGTRLILVMGHRGCGAVQATMQGGDAPGQIGALFPYIRPALEQAGQDLDAVVRANAKIQAGLVRDRSPVISAMVKEKKLKVVAAYYDLASGVVTPLE